MSTTTAAAPPDTPARARAASRPRTRQWQRLLSEAEAERASAGATRAALRTHLAAAERLHKRRAHEQQRRQLRVLADATAPWTARRAALRALGGVTDAALLRAAAPCLAAPLNDLRSALVVAAARCVERLAPHLAVDDAVALFRHALRAAHATKKVLHDARRDAALAVAACRVEHPFWHAALLRLDSPHPVHSAIVLHACTARIATPSALPPEQHRALADLFTLPALQRTATDRAAHVRDAARALFHAYATAFGTQPAHALLQQLDKPAQARLNSVLQPDPTTAQPKPQRISIKQHIQKAKQQALRKQRLAAAHTDPQHCHHIQSLPPDQVASNDQENVENNHS